MQNPRIVVLGMWSLVDYVEMGRGTVSQSMMRRLESQIGLWLFPRREANLAPREQYHNQLLPPSGILEAVLIRRQRAIRACEQTNKPLEPFHIGNIKYITSDIYLHAP